MSSTQEPQDTLYLHRSKRSLGIDNSSEVKFEPATGHGTALEFKCYYQPDTPDFTVEANVSHALSVINARIAQVKQYEPNVSVRLHHTASVNNLEGERAIKHLSDTAIARVSDYINAGSKAFSHRAQALSGGWLVFGYDIVLIPSISDPSSMTVFVLNDYVKPRYKSWCDIGVFTDAGTKISPVISKQQRHAIRYILNNMELGAKQDQVAVHKTRFKIGQVDGAKVVTKFQQDTCPGALVALLDADRLPGQNIVADAPGLKQIHEVIHDLPSFSQVSYHASIAEDSASIESSTSSSSLPRSDRGQQADSRGQAIPRRVSKYAKINHHFINHS